MRRALDERGTQNSRAASTDVRISPQLLHIALSPAPDATAVMSVTSDTDVVPPASLGAASVVQLKEVRMGHLVTPSPVPDAGV